MHFIIKLIQSIVLSLIFNASFIFTSNSSSSIIKKDLSIPLENDMKLNQFINKSNDTINNNTKLFESATEHVKKNSNENLNHKLKFSDTNKFDIPKTAFVVCIIVGLIVIGLISCKAYKMRRTRAERRYGVQGDRSAQELTPLPIAIEEDDESDIEDHTLFDRNRIT